MATTALLTVRDVAKRLAVSASSVYALVETGRLACHRIGIGRGTIRIDETDLAAFLDACRSAPRPAPRRASTRPQLKHLRI
jgi:excisionase family DNA binding protein